MRNADEWYGTSVLYHPHPLAETRASSWKLLSVRHLMLIPMKSLTQVVVLGLLLLPFAAAINIDNAYAEMREVVQCAGSGDANNDCFFVPSEITVNVGDTVVWLNDDSATHTITSGDVNDPDNWSAIFESGLGKPKTTFEHTFDTAGEYPYLCQLHPWMIGKVIVVEGGAGMPGPEMPEKEMPGETVLPGEQIDLAVNHELPLDIAEYDDFMLTFKSKGSDGNPIVHTDYRITVMKDGEEIFKHNFHDHDGILELEFKKMDQAPMVTDPAVDDPGKLITGPFGVQGTVLSENGAYDIKAEITGIEFKPLSTSISQDFSMNVVPEFPIAALLPLMLAFAAIVAVMRIRSGKNLPSL
ncbi:MAG: plastocyanin/azurin family copper-binding protein [Nitrososphaerales archaeon]